MTHSATRVSDVSAEYRANNLEIDVPAGYKRTEIGLIPYEWTICELGELGQTLSGGTPRMSDRRFWHGSIPWVSSKDMKVLNIDDSIDHVTPLAIGNGTRIVEPGTILILVRGMTLAHSLPVGIVRRRLAFNQDLKAFVCVPGVHREFLLRWLEANETKILLLTTESTHGTKRLPTEDLLGCLVALPSVEEQRAIAEALSDVDGLLESLDRLIAKKRAVKQAAMQQLLTGKTRLPGFNEEWQPRQLGEHLRFLRNGTNSRAELSDEGPIKYLHYGDIHTSTQVRLDPASKQMPSLNQVLARRLDRLEDGDLVFADASEDLEGVGKSVEISNRGDTQVVSGLHTIAVRFDSAVLAHGFKAYLQYVPSFISQLRKVAAGTKVYATTRSHIAAVEMRLPAHDEQAAIAQVLSDMDAEIDSLVGRRNKTQKLKQGMMQQLLTGRARLITADATVAV